MWPQTHSVVTKEVTKEQMWKLLADVNNWHKWDSEIDYAKMEGKFEKGNYFELKPKGAPKVRIELVETVENRKFVDLTKFPLAKMYGEHTFEETPDGLKITTTMRVEGLLSFLWVKLVAKGIVDGLPNETEQQIKFAKKL
jgi:Polyketide cyclase / dehydrase and lipid transport